MSGKLIHSFKRKRAEESSNVNCSSESGDDNENHNKRLKVNSESDDLLIEPEPESNVEIASRNQQNGRNNEEFLRLALLKIQELENELALLDEENYDSGHDDDDDEEAEIDQDGRHEQVGLEAEALGFALCARETLNYLASEGITGDNPVLTALKSHLIGKCRCIPI